ncbi:helix-turn-helix domain-containing protein [Alkalilacustris brevis]|uniref:helix-turn-helix domain-containing protein n=1 Tax=Alkalilacustris brevis TaxID=2026338 RepID=UPI001EE4C511|nr:AraC family transcriptional regulator [Alkalilacustris brevis]
MQMTVIPDPSFGPRIVPIPRLASGGRWRVEAMRSQREPVLLWFTQGQGRITVSGTTRGYGAHNAIFLPPRTMYGFEMLGRVFGNAVFFGHTPDVALPGAPLHLRVRDVAVQNELNAILDNTQRELSDTRPGQDRAVHHYIGLLGVWLERQQAEASEAQGKPPRPDAARRLAERYARLLERDFSSGMNVADFAAALNVTPTHLSRACKASCGRPAHALLQDRVLFEARKLLVETQRPIKDVARQLGFASPAYFTRAFQAQVGKTPSAFRRGG